MSRVDGRRMWAEGANEHKERLGAYRSGDYYS
jgi:hypothetical protein